MKNLETPGKTGRVGRYGTVYDGRVEWQVEGGGGNRGVNLPSPHFLSQFLPSSYFFEPISPSSLNVYVSFSPSSLLFPPISPSSQLFLGHFSLLPILFLPPLLGPHNTTLEEFAGKRRFYFENASNVLRPHYAEKCENATIAGGWKSWLHLWGLGVNNMIIKSLSFSKTSVVKMSSVHTKTQTGVTKFLQWEEFFRKAPFLTGLVWTVGLTVGI